MTPRPMDEVKKLYEMASGDARLDYLFEVMVAMHNKLDCVQSGCRIQLDACTVRFVSKRQAKFTAFVIFIGAACFGFGAGLITFKEFIGLVR